MKSLPNSLQRCSVPRALKLCQTTSPPGRRRAWSLNLARAVSRQTKKPPAVSLAGGLADDVPRMQPTGPGTGNSSPPDLPVMPFRPGECQPYDRGVAQAA